LLSVAMLTTLVLALQAPVFASAQSGALPTLAVSLSRVSGVTLSATTVQSGAVSISSTFTGKLPKGSQGPGFGIVRLNPGVSIQQAAGAVQSHHGDLDALTPYGTLMANGGAPATVQTVLTPGSYVALNLTGNQPAFAPFTVVQAASPAALPAAKATETSIEFAFRGPTVLHVNTIVRAQNAGYLVHMITLIGVRNQAIGKQLIALAMAGKDRQAQKLATGSFVSLLEPASPGAMQQQVLQTKPGYYVEACFMDTQDGREHIQLGMARLVKVIG
jgi:hypothetical protein